MKEYLNLYDGNKEITEDVWLRNTDNVKFIPTDRYYMVVFVIIENLKGELLFQITSVSKNSKIALTSGHVKQGSNSLKTVLEEVDEELGIKLDKSKLKFIQSIKLECKYHEVYYIKDDIKIEDMILQKSEVDSVAYYTRDEVKKLFKNERFRKSNRGIVLDFLLKNNK